MGELSSRSARRKEIRWDGFDYRIPGIYFVTLCTVNREKLFGRVDDTGRLHPSPVGWCVSEGWHQLPDRFPGIELIAYVAMPDHIHGLLAIAPNTDAVGPPFTLGRIVSVFKSMANHQAPTLKEPAGPPDSLWQRGYHDRVVRSDDEMRQIEWYIKENLARWASSRMSSAEVDGERGLA